MAWRGRGSSRMADGTDRVCPGCGTAAGENDYCSKCGFHLAEEPELPTREEWETRDAAHGERPEVVTAPTPWTGGGSEAGQAHGSTAQGASGGPGRSIRERWSALGTTTKRSIVSGSAIVIVGVIVILAISGGGGSSGSSNTGSGGSNVGNSASAAQVCASAWNSEASQLDRQLVSSFARAGVGRAAAGYESADPSLCLITFANSSDQYAAVMQFNQQPGGGGFVQGATGSAAELPGNWVWNATANSDGTVAPG